MLTKEETVWLKKLQKLLDNPPSDRMGFYTTGDPTVTVYDHTWETSIHRLMDNGNYEFGNAVDAYDARLGELKFPNCVHSTAG